MLLTLVLVAALSGAGYHPARPEITPVSLSSAEIGGMSRAVARPRSDSLDITLYAQVLKSADQRVLDTVLLATAMASSEIGRAHV